MATGSGESRTFLQWGAFAVVVVIALWIGIGFGPMWLWSDPQQRSAFGEVFGAVNALFSGLG